MEHRADPARVVVEALGDGRARAQGVVVPRHQAVELPPEHRRDLLGVEDALDAREHLEVHPVERGHVVEVDADVRQVGARVGLRKALASAERDPQGAAPVLALDVGEVVDGGEEACEVCHRRDALLVVAEVRGEQRLRGVPVQPLDHDLVAAGEGHHPPELDPRRLLAELGPHLVGEAPVRHPPGRVEREGEQRRAPSREVDAPPRRRLVYEKVGAPLVAQDGSVVEGVPKRGGVRPLRDERADRRKVEELLWALVEPLRVERLPEFADVNGVANYSRRIPATVHGPSRRGPTAPREAERDRKRKEGEKSTEPSAVRLSLHGLPLAMRSPRTVPSLDRAGRSRHDAIQTGERRP
ncbi:MAG: hypothetical protein U0324_36865 [Polyangiales bacterium]